MMAPHDELDAIMAAQASGLTAADRQLDYSLVSLDHLDHQLRDSVAWDASRLEAAAAYVGEVIRRGSAGAHWAARPRRVDGPEDEPGIVKADMFADPFDFVRGRCGVSSGSSLRNLVAEVLTYFDTPSAATARRLGWSSWFRFADRRHRRRQG